MLSDMNKEDICYMPAWQMVEKIRTQELSSQEITEIIIERIEKINPKLNSYCTTTFDLARKMAKKADDRAKTGENVGLLNGIPTSIKDTMDIKGIRTTYGSKFFEHHIPKETTVDVQRLIDAGCVILGKTNNSEFAFFGVTNNEVFGVTNNPWNLERTCGGSSGGAGASVAAGISPLALGSDGGGSIRIPASLNGIYGLKPNFGRIPIYPRNGLGGFTVCANGPMTNYVKDAALMLDVLKGFHEADRDVLPDDGVSYFKKVNEKPNKLKIAFSLDLGNTKQIEPEVEKAVTDSVQKFEELGWTVDTPKSRLRPPTWAFNTTYTANAAYNLGPYLQENRELLGSELVKSIEVGLTHSAVDLLNAFNARKNFYEKMYHFMKNYDVLITPTLSVTAFPHGILYPAIINGKGVPPTGWQPNTWPFNLTGHPAASIPCGWSEEGLPIGMQIIGHRFDELTVLQVSQAFEEIAPWQDRKPNLFLR
ncbi:MAG: amidase [Promethearchaeota archaeon]|nr:MAG: amidase [Candidatus Lokiarchaeota archaeon]